MSIRENATVKVVGGAHVGETGKVVRIYDDLGIALVALGTDSLGKVFLYDMVEIRPQETEPKTEIPEGAKKISRADFDNALIESNQYMMDRTSRNLMSGVIGTLTGTIVGADIADKIFKDQDVVVMTEDQLIAELWAGCSPEAVNESVGGQMGIGKAMDVSIAAIMNLRKIPGILFGGENG